MFKVVLTEYNYLKSCLHRVGAVFYSGVFEGLGKNCMFIMPSSIIYCFIKFQLKT